MQSLAPNQNAADDTKEKTTTIVKDSAYVQSARGHARLHTQVCYYALCSITDHA